MGGNSASRHPGDSDTHNLIDPTKDVPNGLTLPKKHWWSIFCCCCQEESTSINDDTTHNRPTFLPLSHTTRETTQYKSHVKLITGNYVHLVNDLRPELFLHLLDPVLRKNVSNDLDRKDQTRELLDLLQRYPKKYFDNFCVAIAALHPDIFQILTGRNPTETEKVLYLKPFSDKLKADILSTGNKPDNPIDTKINLDTQFVTLRLVESPSSTAKIMSGDHYSDLLKCTNDSDLKVADILQEDSSGKLILITGRAGVGKSTLAQFLNRLWAKGQWANSHSAVFLLNLRRLAHMNIKVTFSELLGTYAEYVPYPLDPKQPPSGWLERNQEQVLLFLDGIDELTNIFKHFRDTIRLTFEMKGSPLEWCVNLMDRRIMERSTLLLVSRPFSDLSKLAVDRHLDVFGLTPDKVEEFIQLNVKSERQEIVKQTLSSNPVLLSTCAIAFYCAAITSIIEEDEETIDSDSLHTYTRITSFIVTRSASRQTESETDAAVLPDELWGSLAAMAALAYKGVPNRQSSVPQLVFNDEDLNNARFSTEAMRNARKTGLLIYTDVNHPTRKNRPRKLEAEFVHLLIQELFAAGQIIESGQEKIHDYMNKKFSGRFNMTQLFLYGIALDQESGYISGIINAIRSRDKDNRDTSFREENIEDCLLDHLTQFSDKMLDSNSRLHSIQLAYESQNSKMAQAAASSIVENQTVDLSNLLMTAVDMKALFFTLQHSDVRSLSLQDISLDTACIWVIQTHMPNTAITSLHLRSNHLTTSGLRQLTDGIRRTTLRSLSIRENCVTQDGMEHLATMIRRTHLNELILTHVCITDDGIQLLSSAIMDDNHLNHLVLSHDRITDIGMWYLAAGLKTTTILSHLELVNSYITEKGMAHLAEGIAGCQSLTHLTLWQNRITTRGMEYLSDGINRSSKLRYLSLSDNEITEDGMRKLSEGIQASRSLTRLQFYENKMSTQVMGHLCQAVGSAKTLTHLQLVSTEITDGGMDHLAQAISSSSCLRCVQIAKNRITDQGVNYLTEEIQAPLSLSHLQLINVEISLKGEGLLKKRSEKHGIRFQALLPEVYHNESTIETCIVQFSNFTSDLV